MFVYFAQPIDQASRTSPIERDLRILLVDAGASLYSPSRAYSIADNPLSDLLVLDRINRAALAACDALVAWLPETVPTLGVPAEIEQALGMGKPTVIFTSGNLALRSVQIQQWRERGALVYDEDDLQGADPQALRDALRTGPVSSGLEPVVPTPPLLVKYEDASTLRLSRAYHGDAGLDLAVSREVALRQGEYRRVPTGVRAAVPHGWFGFMHGRSSAWSSHRLQIQTAIIDSGYRGELEIGITNMSAGPVMVPAGTRLAQYVLLPAFMGGVMEVDELPEHERGMNGYGSSGL